MRAWICTLLLSFAMPSEAGGIPRWDALPAVDVEHLLGPYAGRSVCPMCRHGYDAGVLVFLPARTPPMQAQRIARAMQAASAGVGDARFRPFLVFAGARPSPALLAAVKGEAGNWYVGYVPHERLSQASRDFRRDLDWQAWGYVFAQRRLLWSFEPGNTGSDWPAQLPKFAAYAMEFLSGTYAQPVANEHPDTPKGRLWAAPSRLDADVAIAEGASVRMRLCMTQVLPARDRNALVGLTPAASRRSWWARTDAEGCVSAQGRAPVAVQVELFRSLQAPLRWQLNAGAWQRGARVELTTDQRGQATISSREPIVGGPCENCELVFRGLPARIASVARIAPANEPGEALRLSGTIRDQAGNPQAGVVLYAYHTDRGGRYPPSADRQLRHGRLRGWVRSDAQGRYELHTIRPGGYPGSDIPQHIHLQVVEPGRCTYYIDDVLFADDPRLTPERRQREIVGRGGDGVVRPRGNAHSGWTATRDIVLGLNVKGYATCGDAAAMANRDRR